MSLDVIRRGKVRKQIIFVMLYPLLWLIWSRAARNHQETTSVCLHFEIRPVRKSVTSTSDF